MEKRVKYGVMLLLILITGLLLFGYFYNNSAGSSFTALKTSISANASHLIGLSDQDEALFNQQYLYKVLAVRGIIRKIKKTGNNITVLLGGHPSQPVLVSCSLDTLYNRRPPDLQTGDSCTILGNCAGRLKDIILLQCIIEK